MSSALEVRELALQAMSKGPSPCDLLPAIEQALLLAMREQAQRDAGICEALADEHKAAVNLSNPGECDSGCDFVTAWTDAAQAIRAGAD